jgi:hypothetical protein
MKKPPRPGGWVIKSHPFLGSHQKDHEPDNLAWSIKFPSLLPGRVGKIFDKIFICSPEHIRELKVIIPEPVFIEVVNELLEFLV